MGREDDPGAGGDAADAGSGLTCVRGLRDRESPVPHSYELTGEEYGSLASGGSYEVYTCGVCGRVAYSPMPD